MTLSEFFWRGTRIRCGAQRCRLILLISRLNLRKREKALAAQDVQAAVTRNREEPWLDMHVLAERGKGEVELEPYLLHDIMRFVILAHIVVDQSKKRFLIPAYQRFECFLITSKRYLNQDAVRSFWIQCIPLSLCLHGYHPCSLAT